MVVVGIGSSMALCGRSVDYAVRQSLQVVQALLVDFPLEVGHKLIGHTLSYGLRIVLAESPQDAVP